MNFWKVADVWHTLMTEVLGYAKYAAGGCDVGALVTGQLGHKYADELYGIHIGSGAEAHLLRRATGPGTSSGGHPLAGRTSATIRARIVAFETAVRASTWPRTCSTRARSGVRAGRLPRRHARLDAGALDELVRQRRRHRERVQQGRAAHPRDDLLGGNAIDTSIRTYANNNRYPWTPSHDRSPVVEAPPASPSSATRTRPA